MAHETKTTPGGPIKDAISIGEAARQLGVSVATLRAWSDQELVPHFRLPSGYRRFSQADIDRIVAEMYVEGAPKKRAAA